MYYFPHNLRVIELEHVKSTNFAHFHFHSKIDRTSAGYKKNHVRL